MSRQNKSDKRKIKQKRKHGANRYSLDFYTDLTIDECVERLKSWHQLSISISEEAEELTHVSIWNRNHNRFEGNLEPYIAGTRVYGSIQHNTSDWVIPGALCGLWMLMAGFFIWLGLRSVMAWSGALLIGASPALGVLLVLVLNFLSSIFRILTRAGLLHRIYEQLNVEATHETETEA